MTQKWFFILSGVLLIQFSSHIATKASECNAGTDSKTSHDELFHAVSSHIFKLVQSNVEGFLRIHKLLMDKSDRQPATILGSNSAIDYRTVPLPAVGMNTSAEVEPPAEHPLNSNTEKELKTNSTPAHLMDANTETDVKTRHRKLFNLVSSYIYRVILFNIARVQRMYKLLIQKATEMPEKSQIIAQFLPQLKDYVEYIENFKHYDDNFLKFLISSQLLNDLELIQSNIDTAIEAEEGDFAEELKAIRNTAIAEVTEYSKESTKNIVSEVGTYVAGLSQEERKTENRFVNWWLALTKEDDWKKQREIVFTYLL